MELAERRGQPVISRWRYMVGFTFVCLLALLCLLAVAPSARAECAWVLWEERTFWSPGEGGLRSGTTTWQVTGAQVFKQECEVAGQARSDVALKALQDGKPSSDAATVWTFKRFEPSRAILITYKDGSRVFQGWKCLPDTVDPRGPKGK